jgi:non-specific serine/threonine protein kinase
MSLDETRSAEALFQRALDLPSSLRATYVDEACPEDPALRREVHALLAHYEEAGETFLRPPLPVHLDRSKETSQPVTIGSYPILQELGRGGMGIVYRALDPRLEREVAIKVLPGDVARDPSWRERFRREARILASLSHPNIATVFSLEEADDDTFITMELVRGTLLSARIAASPPSLDRVLPVAQQIAAALEAAHRSYIAHRDLKPLNVMVTPEGHVKVLDFGLARSLERRPALELQGQIAGTPGYMSPELLRGERTDHRADVFAFGCVLFEMLSGTRAFPGPDAAAILRHTEEHDPDWDRLPSDLVHELRDLVERCLDRDPNKRLGSMTTARRVIDELIAHRARPAIARPVGAGAPDTPTNLPVSLTSFVGRAEVLTEVTALLAGHRLVTLVGPGGCGKSRLAVELGRCHLPAFADGVWLVELAPVADGEAVVSHVASAVGIREDSSTSVTDAVRAHFQSRRALLLLDNCEHLLPAVRELVVDLVAASPTLVILTTSLVPLDVPGESTYRVPSMRVPDDADLPVDELLASGAVRLFVERAAAAVNGFSLTPANAPAVVSICRRLDGIPLAIELAAARVRVLPPHEIDRRLDDRFRLLRFGSRSGPERHRTLRALMEWSYEQLDPGERRLLERLSVFAGGFGLDAAEVVGTGDEVEAWEVLDILSRLLDRSLVEMVANDDPDTRVRYRMLETVRAYAREHLDQPEETLRRHRDHFVALAAEAEVALLSSEQRAWLQRLDLEHENLRMAVEHDLAVDPLPTETVATVSTLMRFAEIRGLWTEGLAIGQRVRALPSVESRSDEHRGRLETRLGSLHLARSDYPAAMACFDAARRVFDAIGDRRGIAAVVNNTGLAAMAGGDYEEARRCFEEALTINREIGNRAWEDTNLNNLGLVLQDLGDAKGAERYFREALALARELGISAYEAGFLNNLGIAVGELGDLEQSKGYHQEALVAARRHGDTRSESIALLNLASVATDAGRMSEARTLLQESLHLKERLDDKVGIIHILESMVIVLRSFDRPGEAARILGAVDTLRKTHRTPPAPVTLAAREREAERLRGALGPTAFDGCWREGATLSLSQAIATAFAPYGDAPYGDDAGEADTDGQSAGGSLAG